MKWFYNLKIATKLIIGFIIVALIAGIVGIISLKNLNMISEAEKLMYEENALGLNHAGQAATYFQRVRLSVAEFIGAEDYEVREESVNNINRYISQADDYLDLYAGTIKSGGGESLLNYLKSHWVKYKALVANIISLVESGNKEEALSISKGETAIVEKSLQDDFDKLFEHNATGVKGRSIQNTKLIESASQKMIIIVISGVLLSIVLGYLISRVISRPIKKMVVAADKLALGDVNVTVKADTKDEVGKLEESFAKMIENIRSQALVAERLAAGDLTVDIDIRSENDLLGKKLLEMADKNNEVLSGIASAAEQVASGAKQVSDSSTELSQGSAEQASSVEELTASLEEISAQTKLNAENALSANKLAENARSSAMQGNEQMQEMLKAMDEIYESSANISNIIKVIDDIAFQTNILALNAAVEAARAGEQGKGFAVVAEEVRNLAARSANAAKETTNMIESSIKKSEKGAKIANNAAGALNKIVNGAEKVATLVNAIAIASKEQAAGIGQINQGILQVSAVVQSNSATAEESATASEELSSQAELLKETVGKFKLKNTSKSQSAFNELSPEILKMLDDMNEKNNIQDDYEEENNKLSEETVKISSSDKEFAKY